MINAPAIRLKPIFLAWVIWANDPTRASQALPAKSPY